MTKVLLSEYTNMKCNDCRNISDLTELNIIGINYWRCPYCDAHHKLDRSIGKIDMPLKEEVKEMRDDLDVKEIAARHNQGKPQYSMVDLACLEPCARVLEFGAIKYARNNWKKGMPTSKILDSLLRHIACIQAGEIVDKESGLPHIGHIQCNAMFLGNPDNEQDMPVLEGNNK